MAEESRTLRVVPDTPTDGMLDRARSVKLGGTSCTMADWIEAASRKDLEDLGIPWYDHPYDRWSILNQELHELLLKTWWSAMIADCPQALPAEPASLARIAELESALDAIGWECDPADPEWGDPAGGRAMVYSTVVGALGRKPRGPDPDPIPVPALELKAGGYYRRGDGVRVGPVYCRDGVWYARGTPGDWLVSGEALHGLSPNHPEAYLWDLVAEWEGPAEMSLTQRLRATAAGWAIYSDERGIASGLMQEAAQALENHSGSYNP